MRTDVGCPAASSGVAQKGLSFYNTSLIFLVFQPNSVLEVRNTFRHATRQVKPLRIISWLTTFVVPLRSLRMDRAVLLPSSDSAKFSYRDGLHGCECRSPSLLSVSRMGCQTHAANKIDTGRSSLDCLVASIHMNGQMRKRRPLFCTLPRHASFNTVHPCLLVPTFSSPAFTPTFLWGLGEGGGSHQ